MKKILLNITAFLLFLMGFLALVLQLVGIKLVYLNWIESFGAFTGFVIKLLLITFGILILVIANSNFAGDREDFDHLDNQ